MLKGAHTMVCAPDGRMAINPTSAPALATAGTGDVLAGTILGLLAQGLAPFDAAVAAVALHNQTGQLASAVNGDAGTLSGDLLPLLPRTLLRMKEKTT